MPSWINSNTLELVARQSAHASGRRRFLVFVVPASDAASPLLSILDDERNFDIAARFYAPPGVNEPLAEKAEFVMTGGLSKFHSAALFLDKCELHESYEGYLFLDGDLEFDAGRLGAFLSVVKAAGLDLAQPSVTRDSYCYWKVALQQPGYIFRKTSFVEIMAPYMSRAALLKAAPTFSRSISGYGLDFVWPELVNANSIGVIDCFQIRHAARVDYKCGPFYQYLSSLGIDIREEAMQVESEYGVKRVHPHSRRGYCFERNPVGFDSGTSAVSVYLPRPERFTENQVLIDQAMGLAKFGPRRREDALTKELSMLSHLGQLS